VTTERSKPVVAIDGPAGAGKSSAARALAVRLGFVLVDTGALYRGVALAAQESGVPWDDAAGLGALAAGLSLRFDADSEGVPRLLIDGRDASERIRTPEISEGASQISGFPEVRAALLEQQRQLGRNGGVVLEGRDIGTVVFPDAEVKIFLTASDETRAQRRHAELLARGEAQGLEQVLEDIRLRDQRDTERTVAPLKPAVDAIHFDTSGLNLEEVVDRLARLVAERAPAARPG